MSTTALGSSRGGTLKSSVTVGPVETLLMLGRLTVKLQARLTRVTALKVSKKVLYFIFNLLLDKLSVLGFYTGNRTAGRDVRLVSPMALLARVAKWV
jgi:hypothetical protein